MTLIEAYEFTLEKVNELRDKGIQIVIEKRPNSKKGLEDKLPFIFWRQVNFINLSCGQVNEIFTMAKYLNMCGIRFEVGGMGNRRDWSLDWSFEYSKENEQLVEAVEECEEQIKKANRVNLIENN